MYTLNSTETTVKFSDFETFMTDLHLIAIGCDLPFLTWYLHKVEPFWTFQSSWMLSKNFLICCQSHNSSGPMNELKTPTLRQCISLTLVSSNIVIWSRYFSSCFSLSCASSQPGSRAAARLYPSRAELYISSYWNNWWQKGHVGFLGLTGTQNQCFVWYPNCINSLPSANRLTEKAREEQKAGNEVMIIKMSVE